MYLLSKFYFWNLYFIAHHLLSIPKPVSYQCKFIAYFNILVDKIVHLFGISFMCVCTYI